MIRCGCRVEYGVTWWDGTMGQSSGFGDVPGVFFWDKRWIGLERNGDFTSGEKDLDQILQGELGATVSIFGHELARSMKKSAVSRKFFERHLRLTLDIRWHLAGQTFGTRFVRRDFEQEKLERKESKAAQNSQNIVIWPTNFKVFLPSSPVARTGWIWWPTSQGWS